MKKIQFQLITVVALIFLLTISIVIIQKQRDVSRPTNQMPSVVISPDMGVLFVDPFLQLEAPLPESFEAGPQSHIDGWDSFSLVPVGNIDRLSIYNFVIEYLTRKKQKISDIALFLQNSYGMPFVVRGEVTILEAQQNLYESSESGKQFQAVHFIKGQQDILIIARATDIDARQQFGQAFVDFVQSLVESKRQ